MRAAGPALRALPGLRAGLPPLRTRLPGRAGRPEITRPSAPAGTGPSPPPSTTCSSRQEPRREPSRNGGGAAPDIDDDGGAREAGGERLPGEGGAMAWRVGGAYFGAVPCDAVFPHTWSALAAQAPV